MMIKRLLFLVLSLFLVTTAGFSEDLVLENETSYPSKDQNTKIAIQWASSADDVEKENHAVAHGLQLNKNSLHYLTKSGKIHIATPMSALYFRVLVWSKDSQAPDLLTNWVDIVPNKTFILKREHLVPAALMLGTGC